MALEEFKGLDDRNGEANIFLHIGELHIARGKYRDAVASLQQALTISQSISAMEIVVRANRAIGSAMMHINSARARRYLSRALLLAEEHSMKLELRNIHRELSSFYKLVGRSTDALLHFEKFYALQREIFTEEADRRLKNIEVMHRVEEYKRSLSELQSRVHEIQYELEEKTRELVDLASRIMEKQDFVSLVERGLEKIIAASPEKREGVARDLLESIRRIDNTDDDWDELVQKFLLVHRVFAERLTSIAPGITPMELKVCVLLRLAMTAKQIAEVLGIEPTTVFNHQQSIRGKLQLINRENLKTYLLRLDVSNDEV
jgi:DNA-binding CsgD family transcriptional regulator